MTDRATIFASEVGKTYVSHWMTVDQAMIDSFADVTPDWNFIHVDAANAAQTPYGGTIAHGFLRLSLLVPCAARVRARLFPNCAWGKLWVGECSFH